MPTASLVLTGIANYELFLRGSLDKIGAFPDALHVGDYKTASNTFTERSFTPAIRHIHGVLRGHEAPRHLAVDEALGNARAIEALLAAARG